MDTMGTRDPAGRQIPACTTTLDFTAITRRIISIITALTTAGITVVVFIATGTEALTAIVGSDTVLSGEDLPRTAAGAVEAGSPEEAAEDRLHMAAQAMEDMEATEG